MSFNRLEILRLSTFEIAANPTISLSEIKARRFYTIDRAQIKAKEQIQADEDAKLFEAINNAMTVEQREEAEIIRLRSQRRTINAILELEIE